VPGLAHEVESEDGPEETRLGGAPAPLLQAALAAAEREARAELARRSEAALAQLTEHGEAEEERLITSAFEGGAPRLAVERALEELRRDQAATAGALGSMRLELDAAALVVPA
jgi:hypothetical protein